MSDDNTPEPLPENAYPPPSSAYPTESTPLPPAAPYQNPYGAVDTSQSDPYHTGQTNPPPGDPSPAQPLPYNYPPPVTSSQAWPPPPGGVPVYQMPAFQTQTNAVLILVLGIVGIVLALSCGVGGLIGIFAWVMGSNSLKAIDQGLANPTERSTVNAGRICGIVSVVLSGVVTAFYVALFAFGMFSSLRH